MVTNTKPDTERTDAPGTASRAVIAAGAAGSAVMIGFAAYGIAFDIVGAIMAAIAEISGTEQLIDLGLDWAMAAVRVAALVAGAALAVATLRRRRRARGACPRCGRTHRRTERAAWDRSSVHAGYAAAALALGYGALKAGWGLGWTFGLDDPHAFGEVRLWTPGLGDTAVLALIGIALSLGFARTWRPPLRMPRWMPLTAAFTGCVMLIPVGIMGTGGTVAVLLGLAERSGGGATGGISPWVFTVIYPWFLCWGVAMAVAAVGYHLRTRGVCRSCGRGRPFPRRETIAS